jgi:hypothetical protein
MELYERKDFIVIDYRKGKDGFCVTSLADTPKPLTETQDEASLNVMKRFGDNLAGSLMFAIGAISAIRLFLKSEYNSASFTDVIFTPDAIKRITTRKYRAAQLLYPGLKKVR